MTAATVTAVTWKKELPYNWEGKPKRTVGTGVVLSGRSVQYRSKKNVESVVEFDLSFRGGELPEFCSY